MCGGVPAELRPLPVFRCFGVLGMLLGEEWVRFSRKQEHAGEVGSD